MKKIHVIYALLIALVLMGCKENPEQNPVKEDLEKVKENPEDQPEDQLGIITDEGAGIFQLGEPLPTDPVGFRMEETTKARMAGGRQLNETVFIIYEDEEQKLILKPQLDPLSGTYTNIIGEIIITSEDYKTAEGIHVNSTLEEFRNAYPENRIWYTYVSDRYVAETPDIEAQFFLDENDFMGEMKVNNVQVPLKYSDFREGAKIKKIRLYKLP